ncbi:TPA: hypothetical protein RMN37_001624 [Escherichia coli]|nr:hypothetical protein [Escherichia coli]MEC3731843.1 hypothetical protein [Escherichia coli]HDW3536669.1 hypothetical protein [Escherichia coli]
MFIYILIAIVIVALGLMNRKGIIDDGEFAVTIVLILSGVAGYLGVSQY